MSNTPVVKSPLIALSLSLVLAGCSGQDQNPAAAPAPRTVQAVTQVVQAAEGAAFQAVTGRVEALESVRVASRLMGYLRDIAVEEGQAVKAGQRLFSIDPLDIEGAVEQARLGLKQAEDAMKDAEVDYRRFETLYKEDVVTRQNFEKMKLNYEMAVTRSAQAKAGLGTAQGQMRYATVTAPINGVVIQKLANEGDIAAPGHPVLRVENPSRLRIDASVSETLYGRLKVGQALMVEAQGQAQPVTARVASVSPAADPVTHSFGIKLDVAAQGLRSGMFTRILVPSGTRQVMTVPAAALQQRAGITGVFVVDPQGIARYRMVHIPLVSASSPGSAPSGRVEILSGLNPGERIVTGKAEAVNNGDKIVE